jgi:hypothetical protein
LEARLSARVIEEQDNEEARKKGSDFVIWLR